jgi:hypothetical protein
MSVQLGLCRIALLFAVSFLAAGPKARAADASASAPAAAAASGAAAPPASQGTNGIPPGPRPMDGVFVEAVETYSGSKSQQIDFGLSTFPLDPYYNGFGIDLAYAYFFNKTYAWQVINVDYVFGVDKGLRSQLAQNWGVQPQSIEQIAYIVSTSLEYLPVYGKFISFKEYIRYFRSAFFGGPAFVATNQQSTVGLNLGWRLEAYVNSSFAWNFQLRDVYVFGGLGNNMALVLGTSYGF